MAVSQIVTITKNDAVFASKAEAVSDLDLFISYELLID